MNFLFMAELEANEQIASIIDPVKKSLNLPSELELLYNNTKGNDRYIEYYKDSKSNEMLTINPDIRFQLYNIEKVITNIEYSMKHYQHDKFVDIGESYMGMGHYCVLAWDRGTRKYFFRHDGGSNGFEREEKEKFFMTKLNLEDERYKDKVMTFDEVIKTLINGINRKIIIEDD